MASISGSASSAQQSISSFSDLEGAEFRLDSVTVFKAFQDAQRQLNAMKAENANLKAEVAALRSGQPSTNQCKDKIPQTLAAQDDEVTKYGKVFQCFYNSWVDSKAFHLPRPEFPWDSDNRYTATADENAGTAAELYACIPEKFHAYMAGHGNFSSVFQKSLSAGRSSMLSRARTGAATIFGKPAGFFDIKALRSLGSADPERLKLDHALGYKENARSAKNKYAVFPPLLYLNDDPAEGVDGLFRNRKLMELARLICYGPSSYTNRNATFNASSPFYSRVKGTTFGLIACIATLARFLHSGDPELNASGIGGITSINYRNGFDEYKRLLIVGRDTAPIIKLLREWDSFVFPSIAPAPGSEESDTEENEDNASEIEGEELISLMRELRTGESSSRALNLSARSQSQNLPTETSPAPLATIVVRTPNEIPSIPASPLVSESGNNSASPEVEIRPPVDKTRARGSRQKLPAVANPPPPPSNTIATSESDSTAVAPTGKSRKRGKSAQATVNVETLPLVTETPLPVAVARPTTSVATSDDTIVLGAKTRKRGKNPLAAVSETLPAVVETLTPVPRPTRTRTRAPSNKP